MLELIYTSAPQGLLPGRSGFSTVAITAGMPPNLIVPLENLSGYNFTYQDNQLPPELNPVCCYYVKFRYGNQQMLVAGRVAPNGLDYSKRNNKIAHNIKLESPDELNFAGGAAELFTPAGYITENSSKVCGGVFVHDFQRPPCELDARRLPSGRAPEYLTASTWDRYTANPATAAFIAYRFRENPHQPLYVKFDRNTPVEDLLALTAEVCRLLEPHEKADFTFSTYFHSASAAMECFLRFIPDFSPHLGNLQRFHRDTLIELGTVFAGERMQQYLDSDLAMLAVNGYIPQPEIIQHPAEIHNRPEVTEPAVKIALNQLDAAGDDDLDAPLPPQSHLKLSLPKKQCSKRETAPSIDIQPLPENKHPMALVGLLVCVVLLLLAIVYCVLPTPQAEAPQNTTNTATEKTENAEAQSPVRPDSSPEKNVKSDAANASAITAKTETAGDKQKKTPAVESAGTAKPAAGGEEKKDPEKPKTETAQTKSKNPLPSKAHKSVRLQKGKVIVHPDGSLKYELSDDEKREQTQIKIGELTVDEFNRIVLPFEDYRLRLAANDKFGAREVKKQINQKLRTVSTQLANDIEIDENIVKDPSKLSSEIEKYVQRKTTR
ncbi:MAG: hypothetical protein E7052_10200 [Lentisphaerae bacterium]|nr:hypothetical protein [Lentisphaerota bacterium]